MKQLLTMLAMLISFGSLAQEITYTEFQQKKKKSSFFKEIYNDFLKYGTFYAAGNIGNAKLEQKEYFIRTNPDDLYAIPQVVDETVYHPFDYRYGIGIRKLARFDYEIKPGNFWTGDNKKEKQVALSAPTSAVKGLEYLLHWEKERHNGNEFDNKRLFIRHTCKNHIAKFEAREQGNVGFQYTSGELRYRLPIGNKLSISAGAIYRTHQQPYGYNPIEIWLNEVEVDDFGNEYPANYWYTLGYEYGYTDIYYSTSDQNGNQGYDWYWTNEQGETVAYTDRQFRDLIMPGLLNRYNQEQWDLLDPFGEVAPIIGLDFYHYKNSFWLHTYGNWILPYHKYLKGDEAVSYLNRNNWGKGGLRTDADLEQWSDYQAGLIFGWKVSKSIGVFIEGEYTKFWDSKIYSTNFGLNITMR